MVSMAKISAYFQTRTASAVATAPAPAPASIAAIGKGDAIAAAKAAAAGLKNRGFKGRIRVLDQRVELLARTPARRNTTHHLAPPRPGQGVARRVSGQTLASYPALTSGLSHDPCLAFTGQGFFYDPSQPCMFSATSHDHHHLPRSLHPNLEAADPAIHGACSQHDQLLSILRLARSPRVIPVFALTPAWLCRVGVFS